MSERTEERTKTHARDCISRQKAIDAVNAWLLLKTLNRTMSNAMSLQDVLRQLPSAQPEVIRCKDCKWFGDIGCAIIIVDDSDKPTENDFCSFAERRTDG